MTERRKPGPTRRIQEPRKEYHLKFVPELAKYIDQVATNGYQAYFDELVQRDLQQRQSHEEK